MPINNQPTNKDICDFYELLRIAFKKIMDIWLKGEGSLEIKITDEKGRPRAKISGGEVERIGENT